MLIRKQLGCQWDVKEIETGLIMKHSNFFAPRLMPFVNVISARISNSSIKTVRVICGSYILYILSYWIVPFLSLAALSIHYKFHCQYKRQLSLYGQDTLFHLYFYPSLQVMLMILVDSSKLSSWESLFLVNFKITFLHNFNFESWR